MLSKSSRWHRNPLSIGSFFIVNVKVEENMTQICLLNWKDEIKREKEKHKLAYAVILNCLFIMKVGGGWTENQTEEHLLISPLTLIILVVPGCSWLKLLSSRQLLWMDKRCSAKAKTNTNKIWKRLERGRANSRNFNTISASEHLMFVLREIYDYDKSLMPFSWHIQLNYRSWFFFAPRRARRKRRNM